MCPDLNNQAYVKRVLAHAAYPAHRRNLWLLCQCCTGCKKGGGTWPLLVGDRDGVRKRRYRMYERWYNLRPGALAAYRVGQQHLRFWLEWDRGTMNARSARQVYLVRALPLLA